MDNGAYFSGSRDFLGQDSLEIQDYDHPECQSHESAFSCGSSAEFPSMDEQLESSSDYGYCHSYKDDCNPVIFDRRYNFADRELCSRHFSVRLGGLRNKMAAVLRRYIGCKVIIGTECDSKFKKISGKISFVGNDFVEIVILKNPEGKQKHSKKKYRMIPFDTINWFERDQGS
ncbi:MULTISPECIES: hypothetical protein [unclassified Bacillus (in: firmicutes)]|uniref:hypothetical protein n=1 Tax=unclassified Bacillus (in: firmicutes) TaxID=185979 RepID=UPI001BE88C3D|nr:MULTISPECIES: hypothetical protein [unclassified Bacillus (in: firmicutes)]MBT2638330.1 hypothetical protein [Bacillus sp. ISL-39]MBT2661314.1 hypothetical protein [Bacillus sp. ISL-45]